MTMPDKVAVTFMKFTKTDADISLVDKLRDYIKDGQIEIVAEDNLMVTAKIDPQFATFIKLKDPDLANRMHVSYITGELKDKFRTRPGLSNL